MKCERLYSEENHIIAYSYNTTIKTYANGDKNIKYHSYENLKGIARKRGKGTLSDEEKDYLKHKNLMNTKATIIDLIYHNGLIKQWDYFITLTFDDNIINGYDYESSKKALIKWLNNQKHQNKDMEYVIVPEYHKSKRFHFHGVVRNVEKWSLSPAVSKKGRAIYKNGVRIYNLDNYKYGYTTISKIRNAEAVSVYTSKYITKEFIDIPNAKKYWASKTLEKPKIEYAQLTEDGLKFYIDNDKIKRDEYRKETDNYTSYYVKLRTSYNIYYVNFYVLNKKMIKLIIKTTPSFFLIYN